MNYLFRVCLVERVGYLGRYVDYLRGRERLPLYYLIQRFTFDILHRYEGHAFRLVDLVDVRNVRVRERGRGLRFQDEAAHLAVVVSHLGREDFKGHSSFKFRVTREVNFAHSALPNLRADFVLGEI